MNDDEPIIFTACGVDWDNATPEFVEALETLARLAYEATRRGDLFPKEPQTDAKIRRIRRRAGLDR